MATPQYAAEEKKCMPPVTLTTLTQPPNQNFAFLFNFEGKKYKKITKFTKKFEKTPKILKCINSKRVFEL